jgi:hypothetical protein
MPAGLIFLADIYRIAFPNDDTSGGAMSSGTCMYYNVQLRMSENKTEQLLLQQGLETTKIFAATIIPGTLIIYERDEVQIISPRNHQYYGERFRVIDVQSMSFAPNDPRNYLVVQLTRSVRAHSVQ